VAIVPLAAVELQVLAVAPATPEKAQAAEAQAPAADPQSPVLHLKDRDFVAGELVDSPDGGQIVWKSPVFIEPLKFPFSGIRAIQFPSRAKPAKPEGEYCFELAGGDMLFGNLVGLDQGTATIEVSGLGQLHVDRTIMRRMYRWNREDLIFSGPNGLEGWQVSASKGGWREDSGHLTTEEIGAVVRRDFTAPAQARYEVELSWVKKPDFDLAFGVGNDPKSVLRAFRFEVWDNKLVAWRETEREADVTALAKIESGPGHVHLQALVDQEHGRMLVFSSAGEQLADLKVTTGKPQAFGGVQLTNKSGDIRLERLRISRWNGEAPRAVEMDKARIHNADGAATYGQLDAYDAPTRQFVFKTDAGIQRLNEGEVHDVFLSEAAGTPDRALRAVHISGLRISGDLEKIEAGKISLRSPGIREPLVWPIAELQGLAVLDGKAAEPTAEAAAPPAAREGKLEIAGTRLHGHLVEAGPEAGSALVWQPRQTSAGSPLAEDLTGRIVYRERTSAPKAQPRKKTVNVAGAVAVGGGGGGLIGAVRVGGAVGKQDQATSDAVPRQPAGGAVAKAAAILHLRCGDAIPCTVDSIDEKGVSFHTPLTDSTFVRHDQIQALELMPDASAATIAKLKKERLLTLPRMQRDSPPTQLIRSLDGDYLRGRLISMDENKLEVELRLETKTIERNRVARIIWLYPESEDRAPAQPDASRPSGIRVQAIQSDGNRLTFFAEKLEAGTETLCGRSELLGACRLDVPRIDELILGTAIEEAAATLAFHQWKLKAAAEPLETPDEGEGGDAGEGLESALVGKPAPEFQLDMLDGSKFNLADHRNKVLILDFWASWCGPCLQVMPQVDKVAAEFADQGVKLVAVNLEETPDQVKGALERLQLHMPVALDRNGRVAEKYGATSIPQTVIVGPDGKVARLFVGASARFDEQLRTALRSVLPAAAGPQQ
jgi:thiol-disulfide isomerase/thioredoxin